MALYSQGSAYARPAIGVFVYFVIAFALGLYFTFAAVQGDYGIFSRAEINADAETLRAQRDSLRVQVSVMENKTKRLSDTFLDLDLLDQQARDVLGYVRHDEIVIR
ncbi:septum formation initiator family protein [Nereida sp. MMG025]|uniref:FtsB family cell division protein n=1 Tax=Nereida sp. MMG025 TaxID=2909981 RepID=UPI001F41C4E5|nr:septum formation initiator family protein [Nereida sp. MMG025]MCF6443474.1 septum formation initiator family protein [Nereida sp. MMG025]